MSLDDLFHRSSLQFLSVDRLTNGTWEATYRDRNPNIMRQAQGPDAASAVRAVLEDDDLLI